MTGYIIGEVESYYDIRGVWVTGAWFVQDSSGAIVHLCDCFFDALSWARQAPNA